MRRNTLRYYTLQIAAYWFGLQISLIDEYYQVDKLIQLDLLIILRLPSVFVLLTQVMSLQKISQQNRSHYEINLLRSSYCAIQF
jgi:hypothetical protein